MSRTFRILAVFHAVAIVVVAVGAVITSTDLEFAGAWVFFLAPALCYAVLAAACVSSRNLSRSVGGPLVWVTFALALSIPGVMAVAYPGDELNWVLGTVLVTAYLAVAIFLRRRFAQERSDLTRMQRVGLLAALLAGVSLVGASLLLRITADIGRGVTPSGWRILAGQARWITTYYSVGNIDGDHAISWLHPIFGPVGYGFYLLAVVGTIALLGLLAVSRFSIAEARANRFFPWMTAILNLASVWLVTDIFWGWHYELAHTPWLATVAFACWLAMLLMGAVLVLPMLRRDASPWRVGTLLSHQLPLTAFNLTMLPVYFTDDHWLFFPGLAALILGLQLLAWGSTCILTRTSAAASQETAPLAACA